MEGYIVPCSLTMDIGLTPEESMAQADRILRDAGWAPPRTVCGVLGESIANTDGRFAFENLVCGHPPDGRYAFAVKELTKIPQRMAEAMGLDPLNYPDQHHEAAAWLVAAFPADPCSHSVPMSDIAFAPEPEETAAHETHGETGEDAVESAGADHLHRHDGHPVVEPTGGGDEVSLRLPPELGSDDASATEGVVDASDGDFGDERAEPDLIDADFTVHDLETIELIEPTEQDFGRELLTYEEEISLDVERERKNAVQGLDRFIGLDDLDRVRRLRIGDIGAHAAILEQQIEAAAAEQEGEFAALQTFVVTNLDKHTGAFAPQDIDSVARYQRWVNLDSAHHKLSAIGKARKDKTAFVLNASREEVVAFDPEEGWPS